MTTDNICPICNGNPRKLDRGPGSSPVELDPEYRTLLPGSSWKKELWVCSGCLGSGLRSDFSKRVLSGEFNPANAGRTVTTK